MPSSSPEQSIPYDSTPRSFPFLIFLIPEGFFSSIAGFVSATVELSSATGVRMPSYTLEAPVTICKSLPYFSPQSTVQICM